MLERILKVLNFKRINIFRQRRDHNHKSLLLVGVWVNRNWILGNWIKEINKLNPNSTRIKWVASVFAGKHFWESFMHLPLPSFGSYFFSYPSIFESYLNSNPRLFTNRSIVNYTHNDDELGSLEYQASILNQAYSVHFNCSRDAETLIYYGLDPKKIRLVYGAIDDDCSIDGPIEKESKTILLASRYGVRKGLSILPSIVDKLPNWRFLILGRGWEKFLKSTGLDQKPNIEYTYFDRKSRNSLMKRAKIFMSLSSLEGGPIPLIESMSWNCIPVATDTGFARDFIANGQNGFLLPINPSVDEVVTAILSADLISMKPQNAVRHLTWDRISRIVLEDHKDIISGI